MKVAALYVDPRGPYFGRPDVEPWEASHLPLFEPRPRDARDYAGPWPVVAHPPCSRWGRFWWRGELGADGGCFAAAVASVERWGGVLEHPEGSLAWAPHGLPTPRFGEGWTRGARGWACSVDQGRYGHRARKRTWLYFVGPNEPAPLDWRPAVAEVAVAANARTRRLGIELMGALERRLTPPLFAEALLSLARSARP